jgi:hypothetical protein
VLYNILRKMEQHVFKIAIDYRGFHSKGITIYSATKVSYDLRTKYLFLNTAERLKNCNYILNVLFTCLSFQSCPLLKLFVLRKDVLLKVKNKRIMSMIWNIFENFETSFQNKSSIWQKNQFDMFKLQLAWQSEGSTGD